MILKFWVSLFFLTHKLVCLVFKSTQKYLRSSNSFRDIYRNLNILLCERLKSNKNSNEIYVVVRAMFSTHERLKKKTPSGGIGRREFIEHLVEEFHTTTDIEAQEQVTANLSNFAYDPVNWKFLQEADAVELFLQLLSVPNQRMQLHGVAGLCNICLGSSFGFISKPANILNLAELFLKSENVEIVLNCVTLFWQILNNCNSAQLKQLVATPDILKRTLYWKQTSNDLRIKNISTVFFEDFGTRIETLDLTLPL